jgi:hypothetical protein
LIIKFIEEGDYDDTITGVQVGEDWMMSEFLAANENAMRQTTTIRSKIEEEKKQRGLNSTSRSMISEIKRSASRPITPTKSNSKIPFIDEHYLKSPMRTRNLIPRTPGDIEIMDEGNDFKNVNSSQLDISIKSKNVLPDYKPVPSFGGPQPEKRKEKLEEIKETVIITHDAFYVKDKIPRTPPHLHPKKNIKNRPVEEQKHPNPKPVKEKSNKSLKTKIK